MDYKNFFKNKKIVVMGLGVLGRGINVAKFLAECGAELLVTDLKTEEQLKTSLDQMKQFPNITYHLGGHQLEDFTTGDMVIKAAGVPFDSAHIAEARKHGIPIKMDASLFCELAPNGVTFVGVTGTRGKTTTTQLIYTILQHHLEALPPSERMQVFLGGNIRGMATLPLLKEVRSNDTVVMELDSWQLQGFEEVKFSPHIAVFTNFYQDHLNYYRGDMQQYWNDKAAIFRYQKSGDTLIMSEQIAKIMSTLGSRTSECTQIVGKANDLTQDWKLQLQGDHNRDNAALALAVARALDVPDGVSKKAIESFAPIEHRLQLVRTLDGISYYNDSTATTPDATIAALRALGQKKNIVLIVGGVNKALTYEKLPPVIKETCKGVVLFQESGTALIDGPIRSLAGLDVRAGDGLAECLTRAREIAKPGDIILLSPAFASFGKHFKNEYDRGEQFIKLVSAL